MSPTLLCQSNNGGEVGSSIMDQVDRCLLSPWLKLRYRRQHDQITKDRELQVPQKKSACLRQKPDASSIDTQVERQGSGISQAQKS